MRSRNKFEKKMMAGNSFVPLEFHNHTFYFGRWVSNFPTMVEIILDWMLIVHKTGFVSLFVLVH
jgi:hypothetical protein